MFAAHRPLARSVELLLLPTERGARAIDVVRNEFRDAGASHAHREEMGRKVVQPMVLSQLGLHVVVNQPPESAQRDHRDEQAPASAERHRREPDVGHVHDDERIEWAACDVEQDCQKGGLRAPAEPEQHSRHVETALEEHHDEGATNCRGQSERCDGP
jgi:hypothetical protein